MENLKKDSTRDALFECILDEETRDDLGKMCVEKFKYLCFVTD